jgi:ribosomal-protein-alanine N-acetyltransferase
MKLIISTSRLTLLPFTKTICEQVLNGTYEELEMLNITPAEQWPDEETIDTLPRIINNLNKVSEPTGFESWMVIETKTGKIIGDIGFKGLPDKQGEADLGYGIVCSKRRKGYALEAANGILRWAFSNHSLLVVTASCLIENQGSARILESLGFSMTGRYEKMLLWKLSKEVFSKYSNLLDTKI